MSSFSFDENRPLTAGYEEGLASLRKSQNKAIRPLLYGNILLVVFLLVALYQIAGVVTTQNTSRHDCFDDIDVTHFCYQV